MNPESDVAIVGSGPYALSVAAQLAALGVEHRIFGPPMKFWRDMPVGINLKSLAYATNVVVPRRGFTFPDWCREKGLEDHEPCTMASFAEYGVTMQRRFVPGLEPVEVSRVALGPVRGFELTLANGERASARRVVFATGLTHLASLPAPLRALPPELVSHTFDLSDYGVFRGKEVAVVGAGASAIEAGALVHEAGGRAEILVREAEAVFHDKMDRERSLYERLRWPESVLGYGLKSRMLELAPLAIHFVPDAPRVRFVRHHLGPAAPWWIKDRVIGKVPITVRTEILGAERAGDRVRLRMKTPDGERTCVVDHVVAGTGYVPDVDAIRYLDSDLRRRIRRLEGAPALSMNFESSVKGTYFVGPIAAMSFGPLFRFVGGAGYAAPALARHLAGPVKSAAGALRRIGQKIDSTIRPASVA